MEERDEQEHRVVLHARGMEQKGKGAANAVVTSWLEPGDGVTTVKMQADITLTGTVAQLSRGLLPDVSRKLTAEFAECLQATMVAEERAAVPAGAAATGAPPAAPPQPRAKAIGGIRLGLWAIWSWIKRLFGAGPKTPAT
jgi:hypothetical protein